LCGDTLRRRDTTSGKQKRPRRTAHIAVQPHGFGGSADKTRLWRRIDSAAPHIKHSHCAEKSQNIIEICRNISGIFKNINGISENISDILSFVCAPTEFFLCTDRVYSVQ